MKQIIFAIIFSFAIISAVRTNNPSLGEDLIVMAGFLNKDSKLNDVDMRLFLYGADDVVASRTFDIPENTMHSELVFYDSSSLEPGDYVLRISASHKDIKRRVRHARFVVG